MRKVQLSHRNSGSDLNDIRSYTTTTSAQHVHEKIYQAKSTHTKDLALPISQSQGDFDGKASSIFAQTSIDTANNELTLFSRPVLSLFSSKNGSAQVYDSQTQIVLKGEVASSKRMAVTSQYAKRIRLKQFQSFGLHGREVYAQSVDQNTNNRLQLNVKDDDLREAQIKGDLLRKGRGLELPEQLVSRERQKLEEMNENVIKRLKNQFVEESSPDNSPVQSQQKSPDQRRTEMRKSTVMMNSPLKLKRQGSTIIQNQNQFAFTKTNSVNNREMRIKRHEREHGILQKFRYANEQLEEVKVDEFYKCLKNYRSILDYKDMYQQKDNVYVGLIKNAFEGDQLPKAFPILKKDQKQLKTLDASKSGKVTLLGALNCLKSAQCSGLDTVDVSNNTLTLEILTNLLSLIPLTLNHLNLQGTNLSSQGVQILAEFIKTTKELKSLNLEQNKFGDKGCATILDAIPDNSQIKILNFSKNKITSNVCEAIGNFLKRVQFLRELYLHFNNINQVGGNILFKALLKCRPLKVLDLSFNSLGNQDQFYQLSSKSLYNLMDKRAIISQTECIQSIVKFITKTSEVCHLDLSHNKFTFSETQEIQKALIQNNTLYGFHFEGNQIDYAVDVFGFVQTLQWREKSQLEKANEGAQRYKELSLQSDIPHNHDQQDQVAIKKIELLDKQINQQHRTRRVNGVAKVRENQNYQGKLTLDTCWICEGWQENKISWIPNKSGRIAEQPLFFHASIYDYRPILMDKVGNEFFVHLISPPNSMVTYFFTNPVLGVQTVARDHFTMDLDEHNKLRQSSVYVYNGDIIVDAPPMTQINYIFSGTEGKVIDPNLNYVPVIMTRPREEPKKFDFSPFMGKQVRGWQIEQSFFANYRPDSEVHIEACFQYDFESSKISRLVKDEVETVHDILHDYYPLLFNAYKYYASFGSIYNLPCISMSTFYDLLANTTIMDGKLRSTDIDVMFVSSNGKDQNYPQVFEKAIVRYQFMELMVRIAMDKYYKSGQVKASSLAIMKLFDNDQLVDWLKEFDGPQEWRDLRFWNEECDKIIIKCQPFLKMLFKYTSQINPKNKFYKHIWVSAQDFKDMIVQTGVIGEHLSEREVYQAFLQSMMTQVDELFQPRHYQMNFYEFVEAIARISEKLCVVLPKEGQNYSILLTIQYQDKIPFELHRKLQGFLLVIFFRLIDQMKDSLKNQQDDDYYKMESCMMTEKEYRKHVQHQALIQGQKSMLIQNRGRGQTLFATNSPQVERSVSSSSSSSSDSGSSSQSDKSLDMNIKDYILSEQIKDQNKITSKKGLVSLSRAISKMKQEKISTQFGFSSFVKYINRMTNDHLSIQDVVLKKMGIQ